MHLARVHAAMQLEGVEPVQGALADLFACFDAAAVSLKRAALQLAAPRLGERMARSFEAWVAAPVLPCITPLANRWSMFARPSADISTVRGAVAPMIPGPLPGKPWPLSRRRIRTVRSCSCSIA